ncbi:hypothetical protein MRB53_016936 [Persea americana]|uniref:Uncharacterized protein n=1 Tax=Persea americana TaxID=3435 RepID=A0ACC2M3A3_PERAE|nr:hypothetical protein MRB53_016936 [Persea americana]
MLPVFCFFHGNSAGGASAPVTRSGGGDSGVGQDMARATVIRTSILPSSVSASRYSCSSKRKPYIPSKPSSFTPKTLNHFPILSNCHSRSTHANTTLQTLASQWRIILLFPNCITSIESFEICSYCFSKVSISPSDGIDCSSYDCRVHNSCLSFLPTASNSFICVDCWEPKARKRPLPPPPPDPSSDSSPRSMIRERRVASLGRGEGGRCHCHGEREGQQQGRRCRSRRFSTIIISSALSLSLFWFSFNVFGQFFHGY